MIPFLEKKKREKKKIIGVLTLFDGLNVFKLCWKVLDQESGKIKTGGGGEMSSSKSLTVSKYSSNLLWIGTISPLQSGTNFVYKKKKKW